MSEEMEFLKLLLRRSSIEKDEHMRLKLAVAKHLWTKYGKDRVKKIDFEKRLKYAGKSYDVDVYSTMKSDVGYYNEYWAFECETSGYTTIEEEFGVIKKLGIAKSVLVLPNTAFQNIDEIWFVEPKDLTIVEKKLVLI
jgi:hypothetical protein